MAADQTEDQLEGQAGPGPVVSGRRVVRFEKQPAGGEALALLAATRLNGGPGEAGEQGVTVTAEAASATDLVVEGTAVVHDGDHAAARLRLVEAMNRAVARATAVESPVEPMMAGDHDEATAAGEGEAGGGTEPETAEEAEQRAERLFADVPTGPDRVDELHLAIDCIDLTTLEGDDTRGRVRALCAQAVRPDPSDPDVGPVAAVCVYPQLARLAAELTVGTGVAVASVAGAFPSGLSAPEVKLADIEAALAAGATEIDIVLDRAAFLDGRRADARADIIRARRATTKGRRPPQGHPRGGGAGRAGDHHRRRPAGHGGRGRLHQDVHRQVEDQCHPGHGAGHGRGHRRLYGPRRGGRWG